MARLAVHEPVRLDRRRIEALSTELGACEAERLVRATFDELGEALGDLDGALRAGDAAAIVARLPGLAERCEQVGLPSVAAAAASVAETAARGDGAAFAATATRLVRLIEGSLTAACETPDMRV